MSVIKFPTPPEQLYWVCQCGCFSFMLTEESSVCTNCGTVGSPETGSWKVIVGLPEKEKIADVMTTIDLEDWLKDHPEGQ